MRPVGLGKTFTTAPVHRRSRVRCPRKRRRFLDARETCIPAVFQKQAVDAIAVMIRMLPMIEVLVGCMRVILVPPPPLLSPSSCSHGSVGPSLAAASVVVLAAEARGRPWSGKQKMFTHRLEGPAWR